MRPFLLIFTLTAFSTPTFAQFDLGCTLPFACNYDPDADLNDGSCIFNVPGTLEVDEGPTGLGGFPGAPLEILWELVNSNGTVFHQGGGDTTLNVNLPCGCYGIRATTPNSFNSLDWGVQVLFADTAFWSFSSASYPTSGGTLADAPENVLPMASSDGPCVVGCKDPAACNYNAFAQLSDIFLCTYGGCTDPAACNYNEFASCDTGSCVYASSCDEDYCQNGDGRTVGFAFFGNGNLGYDPLGGNSAIQVSRDYARIVGGNDQSGIPDEREQYVGLVPGSVTFDWHFYSDDVDGSADKPYYEVGGLRTYLNPDGNRIASGTIDIVVASESIRFGIEYDNLDGRGSLLINNLLTEEQICGCTNDGACNYDPGANYDPGGTCCYRCLELEVGGGSADEEISWELINSYGEVLLEGGAQPVTFSCPTGGGCYWIRMLDSGGDGWNGATWSASNLYGDVNSGTLTSGSEDTQFLLTIGNSESSGFDDCFATGDCSLSSACNYIPGGLLDISSCAFPECDDPSALNYAPSGCPGTCIYDDDACGQLTNSQGEYLALLDALAPENWQVATSGVPPSLNPAEGAQSFISSSQIVLSPSVRYLQPFINSSPGGEIQTFVIPTADITLSFDYYYEGWGLPEVEFPFVHQGGRVPLPTDGSFTTGSYSVSVQAGDTLGFGVSNPQQSTFRAHLRVYNLRFAAAPCGCTDPLAVNFSENAEVDNGGCVYSGACGTLVDGAGNTSGFSGALAPDQWDISPGAGNGEIIVGSQLIVVEGNDNGVGEISTQTSAFAPANAELVFDWEFESPDGLGSTDLPYFILNDPVDLIGPQSTRTGGRETITVNEGDEFGFGLVSTLGTNPASKLRITYFTRDDIPCIPGCTYADATNYNVNATSEDGSCDFSLSPCPVDLDGDGSIATGDLLVLLGSFGTDCP